MKGTTIWAANIEVAKVVHLPSRIKGTMCQRNARWSLWRLRLERSGQHLILEDNTNIYTYIVRRMQIKNKTSWRRGRGRRRRRHSNNRGRWRRGRRPSSNRRREISSNETKSRNGPCRGSRTRTRGNRGGRRKGGIGRKCGEKCRCPLRMGRNRSRSSRSRSSHRSGRSRKMDEMWLYPLRKGRSGSRCSRSSNRRGIDMKRGQK